MPSFGRLGIAREVLDGEKPNHTKPDAEQQLGSEGARSVWLERQDPSVIGDDGQTICERAKQINSRQTGAVAGSYRDQCNREEQPGGQPDIIYQCESSGGQIARQCICAG